MIYTFKATIKFDCKLNHPDAPGDKGLSYSDTYRFDSQLFSGGDNIVAMLSHIKRDMALVAGGGYDTDTISNVTFHIEAV